MVHEKVSSANTTAIRIINHPGLGFRRAERNANLLFWNMAIKPAQDIAVWLEKMKQEGKDIIRAAAGARCAPNTPQRKKVNNPLETTFRILKKRLLDPDDSVYDFENEQENVQDMGKRVKKTPMLQSPLTPQVKAARVKGEPLSAARVPRACSRQNNAGRTPAGRSRTISRHRNMKGEEAKASPDIFDNGTNTDRVSSRIDRVLRSQQRPVVSPYAEAVKTVVAEQNAIRKAETARRGESRSPARAAASRSKVNTVCLQNKNPRLNERKPSETMRQIEAKTKAVVKNKEEIVRERAERAKRDREERARRVEINNRKKQEAEAERLRIIRQRELEIAELRRQQASPSRAFRSAHPSRVNTPSYTQLLHQTPNKQAFPLLNLENSTENSENMSQPEKGEVTRSSKRTLTLKEKEVNFEEQEVADSCGMEYGTAIAAEEERCFSAVNANHSPSRQNVSDVLNELSTRQVKVEQWLSSAAHAGLEESAKLEYEDNVDLNAASDILAKENAVFADCAGAEKIAQVEVVVGEMSKVMETDENERERKEAQERLGVHDSSQLMNKNLLNVTSRSSYEMTPDKKPLSPSEDNYNIDDLSSADETDEEDNPKKKVPGWAMPANLRRTLREQRKIPAEEVDAIFGLVEAPDLEEIFSQKRPCYKKRTSSAQWSSPIGNPRIGTSKYFALQMKVQEQ